MIFRVCPEMGYIISHYVALFILYTEKYYIICRYWIPYLPVSRHSYILD